MPFRWYLMFPYIVIKYRKYSRYILNCDANLRGVQQFLEKMNQP